MKRVWKYLEPCVALVWRHVLVMRPEWVAEMLYWTALDVIAIGFLVRGFVAADVAQHMFAFLSANIALWYVVTRSALVVSWMLLDDLFEANFIATFATPLRLHQWICAGMMLGLLGGLLNLLVAWPVIWAVFGYNVFALGPVLFAIIPVLIVSGCGIGFIVSSVILRVGKKGSMLTFQLIWSVMPLACVYYPLQALPLVIQKIAVWVPMTHVFVAVRSHILYQTPLYGSLAHALPLAVGWLAVTVIIFWIVFTRSKRDGLAQLEAE